MNAISMPGGRIIFYEPILDVFDNVDQLAMVMSHEVSHILLRHTNSRISQGFINAATMMFMFTTFDLGLGEIYLSEKLENAFTLKYSRDHEHQADEWGLQLLHRAGFDIEQGPKMIV